MKISIERNRMLLVVLALSMVMCFTGCGHSNSTKEADRLQEEERAEKEAEERKKQLRIRNLEGITLDDQEATFPYNIIMYGDATEAFGNSVGVHLKEDEERVITFSLTKSEDFSVRRVCRGVIVEEDEECRGCYDIETVGNIQIFSLNLPITSKPETVVYQINNEKYISSEYDRFIAFYLMPPDSSETEN